MKNKSNIILILLIALATIIHFRWFVLSDVFTSGDWVYIPQSKYIDFLDFKPIWINSNFGVVSSVPQFYVIRFFEALLHYLFNAGFAINEKIFFLFPIVFLPIIGVYNLVKRFASNKASAISALFYAYSTPYLMFQAGGLTNAMGFALAPILIDRFLKILEIKKNILKHSLIFSLILSISIVYELRVTIITVFICLIFLIRYLVQFKREINYLQLFVKFILVSSTTLLLQAFWLLPIILSRGANSSVVELSQRDIFYSHITFQNAITLFHPYWTGQRPIAFVNNPINSLFYIVPVLVIIALFSSIMQNKKNKWWIGSLSIISFVGIMLTKQTNQPIDWLYEWLFDNIPGFSLYRESSKFYLFTLVGFTGLIALSFDFISNFISKTKIKYYKLLNIILIFIFLLVPALNAYTIANGSFKTVIVPREKPSDYQVLEDYLKVNSSEPFRTLWVPRDSRWTPYSDTFPRVSLIDVLEKDLKNFLPKNKVFTQYEKLLFLLNNQIIFKTILQASAVKYIFVPIQDFENEDDFFIHYGGRVNSNVRNEYISLLNEIDFLQEENIGLETLKMYSFSNNKPYISTSNQLTSISSFTNIEDLLTFNSRYLGGDYSIAIEQENSNLNIQNEITSLFTDITSDSIKNNKIIEETKSDNDITLYSNAYDDTEIKIENNIVNISENQNKKNNEVVFVPNELGNIEKPLFVYNHDSELINEIPNNSFEDGLWSENVGDCNNYDDDPQLDMNITNDAFTGSNALELKTTRHIACTSPGLINVEPDTDYFFSFKYKSSNARQVGFYIGFNNEKDDKIVKFIPIENNDWTTYQQKFTTPTDSSELSFFLYNFELDGRNTAVSLYDDINLIKLPELDNKFFTVSKSSQSLQNQEQVSILENDTIEKKISINNSTNKFTNIFLSESFNSQWKILDKDKQVLEDANHFKHAGAFNGWQVEIPKLCEENKIDCEKNTDGSYNAEIKIRFVTQDLFELGLSISITTLIIVAIILIIDNFKLTHKKKNEELGAIYKTENLKVKP